MSATCKSLRREVVAYQDFDELALRTEEEGAKTGYIQRRAGFPAQATHFALFSATDQIPASIARIKALQVNGPRADQVLLALARPELLQQLLIVSRPMVLPLEASEENQRLIFERCVPLITTERFPNLKTLFYPCKKLVRTLPRTVTNLICFNLEEIDEGVENLEEIFPNLRLLEASRIHLKLLSHIPPTVQILDILVHPISATAAPSFMALSRLHSLRKLKMSLEGYETGGKGNRSEKSVLAHLSSPHLTSLELFSSIGHVTFRKWRIVKVPLHLSHLAVLRMDQPFHVLITVGNPFQELVTLRRLHLKLICADEPTTEWRSIVSCAFEGLPRLKDFRIACALFLNPGVVMQELIRYGRERPEIKVVVTNDKNDQPRPRQTEMLSPWSGLICYRGNDLLVLDNLEMFPNLLHVAASEKLLRFNRALPAKIRTVVIEDTSFTSHDRKTKDFFQRCDDLFNLGRELDVIEARANDEEIIVGVEAFNQDPDRNSFISIIHTPIPTIVLQRKGPGRRSLVARLSPFSEVAECREVHRYTSYVSQFDVLEMI